MLSVVLSALVLCEAGLTSGEHVWPVLSTVTAEACSYLCLYMVCWYKLSSAVNHISCVFSAELLSAVCSVIHHSCSDVL